MALLGSFESSYWPPTPYKVHFWYIFICKTIFRSIYGVYNVPNVKLASKFMIMYLLLSFCQNFAPFADVRVRTIRLHLSKYIFGIVLFAEPFFQSIYGFTVFQMENWPQNWRFCIFELHFAQILYLFIVSELL